MLRVKWKEKYEPLLAVCWICLQTVFLSWIIWRCLPWILLLISLAYTSGFTNTTLHVHIMKFLGDCSTSSKLPWSPLGTQHLHTKEIYNKYCLPWSESCLFFGCSPSFEQNILMQGLLTNLCMNRITKTSGESRCGVPLLPHWSRYATQTDICWDLEPASVLETVFVKHKLPWTPSLDLA